MKQFQPPPVPPPPKPPAPPKPPGKPTEPTKPQPPKPQPPTKPGNPTDPDNKPGPAPWPPNPNEQDRNNQNCPGPGIHIVKKKRPKKSGGGGGGRGGKECPNGGKCKRVKVGSSWVYQFTALVTIEPPHVNIPDHQQQTGKLEEYWRWTGRGAKFGDLSLVDQAEYLLALRTGIRACIYRFYRRRNKYEHRCPDGSRCRKKSS